MCIRDSAGYYPGGTAMTMKVVFERGIYRLLGAQIVGYDGVDKRIDVLATAIRAGLKATDLKDLDLALSLIHISTPLSAIVTTAYSSVSSVRIMTVPRCV